MTEHTPIPFPSLIQLAQHKTAKARENTSGIIDANTACFPKSNMYHINPRVTESTQNIPPRYLNTSHCAPRDCMEKTPPAAAPIRKYPPSQSRAANHNGGMDAPVDRVCHIRYGLSVQDATVAAIAAKPDANISTAILLTPLNIALSVCF